jgi:excinuclease ABC subunit A
MLAADRLLDIGPGPGAAAGDRVRRHAGRAARRRHADRPYLGGRKSIGLGFRAGCRNRRRA